MLDLATGRGTGSGRYIRVLSALYRCIDGNLCHVMNALAASQDAVASGQAGPPRPYVWLPASECSQLNTVRLRCSMWGVYWTTLHHWGSASCILYLHTSYSVMLSSSRPLASFLHCRPGLGEQKEQGNELRWAQRVTQHATSGQPRCATTR